MHLTCFYIYSLKYNFMFVWMTAGISSLTWPSLIGLWGWVRLHTCCTFSWVLLNGNMEHQCCVPVSILSWVHLNIVHYPHSLSAQNVWLVNRQNHPDLNDEPFTPRSYKKLKSYKNYKITPLMLDMWKMSWRWSAWLYRFRHIAKMAAVECKKCTLFHTQHF